MQGLIVLLLLLGTAFADQNRFQVIWEGCNGGSTCIYEHFGQYSWDELHSFCIAVAGGDTSRNRETIADCTELYWLLYNPLDSDGDANFQTFASYFIACSGDEDCTRKNC